MSELEYPVIIVAFLVCCVVAMLFGAFNGVLVAYFKIQPMVATLILYTAGRSIAAWINNNELPIVNDPSFGYFGGFIPGIPIPTPFFIAIACNVSGRVSRPQSTRSNTLPAIATAAPTLISCPPVMNTIAGGDK